MFSPKFKARPHSSVHQQHSPAWKTVDLRTLSGQALRNATMQITRTRLQRAVQLYLLAILVA